MLFHKKIKSDNPPIPNNGVHPSLWSGTENKIKIETHLDKLLFTDFIHTSKVGIVNRLTKEERLISERDKKKIQALYDNDEIDARLKNFFDSLSNAEFTLSKEDKLAIERLAKAKEISEELRDTCFALFGSQQLIPDLVASQIQKLYEKGYLNDKAFTNEGLKCCRDILFNLGYQDILICDSVTSQEDGLRTIVNESGVKNLMIIPGCQHDGMLSGRVLKAVKILNNFKDNLHIYASGGNPLKNPTGPEYVSIAQESKSIHNFFNEMIEKFNYSKPPEFEIIPELDSYDSESNLKNCLDELEDTPHNLIIVSSTFHLIKLAKGLEQLLTKMFTNSPEKSDLIRNIILVGAEGVDADFRPAKSGGYIKSMFVAIFTELLAFKETRQRKDVLAKELDVNGYKRIRNSQAYKLHELINYLGDVQQIKDVMVQSAPKKDSDSCRAMELHTDHPSADYVILECIQNSTSGGESFISDILTVYQGLPKWQKEKLMDVQMKNIPRNEKDEPFYSVVEQANGHLLFYFVPWLTRELETSENRDLIEVLRKHLKEEQKNLMLEPGDILILDNRRMAHGRSEITGSQDRHLRRYSIKSGRR